MSMLLSCPTCLLGKARFLILLSCATTHGDLTVQDRMLCSVPSTLSAFGGQLGLSGPAQWCASLGDTSVLIQELPSATF